MHQTYEFSKVAKFVSCSNEQLPSQSEIKQTKKSPPIGRLFNTVVLTD